MYLSRKQALYFIQVENCITLALSLQDSIVWMAYMGLCGIQREQKVAKQIYVVEVQYICLTPNDVFSKSRINFFADSFYFGIPVTTIKTNTDLTQCTWHYSKHLPLIFLIFITVWWSKYCYLYLTKKIKLRYKEAK